MMSVTLETVDYQRGGLDQAKQKGNYCKVTKVYQMMLILA